MGNSATGGPPTPSRHPLFSVLRASLRVLLLSTLLLGTAHTAVAQQPLLHQQAPSFIRADLNGKTVDLNAYRGKVVLLNFWASWCAPCLLEMPRFADWQRQYAQAGLQTLGVSMDDEPESARSLTRKLQVNYPVLMGDEHLGMLYGGILGLPVTFLIDRRGVIRGRFQGEPDLSAIEVQIKDLLAKP